LLLSAFIMACESCGARIVTFRGSVSLKLVIH
jgi:hypothetical protein